MKSLKNIFKFYRTLFIFCLHSIGMAQKQRKNRARKKEGEKSCGLSIVSNKAFCSSARGCMYKGEKARCDERVQKLRERLIRNEERESTESICSSDYAPACYMRFPSDCARLYLCLFLPRALVLPLYTHLACFLCNDFLPCPAFPLSFSRVSFLAFKAMHIIRVYGSFPYFSIQSRSRGLFILSSV